MAAFNVQHLKNHTVAAAGNTATLTAVDVDSTVELNPSTLPFSGGQSGSAANFVVDEGSIGIALTSSTALTFYREAAATLAVDAFVQAWEYTGAAGGANEFKVRGRGTASIAAGSRTTTATCSTTPTNIDDCVVFISGIRNGNTSNNAWQDATGIAWLSGSNTINFERGGDVATTTFYYVVVEFTGSNWTIHHGFSGDVVADTGSIDLYDGAKGTGTLSDVASWGKAFIYGQFKGDDTASNNALADIYRVLKPNVDTGVVDWEFDAGHDASDNQHHVYAIENSDTAFSVARYNTGAISLPTGAKTQAITAVDSLAEALVLCTSETSGTGTAHMRGQRCAGFDSVSQVSGWCHRSGNTGQIEFQVINLFGMDDGVVADTSDDNAIMFGTNF